MYEYKCVIERVVDGDTVDIMIDLGFNIYRKERIRLARIDAPELRTKEGKAVKKHLKSKIEGFEALVRTRNKDRYGRYIGEIIMSEDIMLESVSDYLVKEGMAKYVKY